MVFFPSRSHFCRRGKTRLFSRSAKRMRFISNVTFPRASRFPVPSSPTRHFSAKETVMLLVCGVFEPKAPTATAMIRSFYAFSNPTTCGPTEGCRRGLGSVMESSLFQIRLRSPGLDSSRIPIVECTNSSLELDSTDPLQCFNQCSGPTVPHHPPILDTPRL